MGNSQMFRMFSNKSGPEMRVVVPNHTFPKLYSGPHHSSPNHFYKSNSIKTTKYSIITFLPINLFEQFHRFANVYFVFILILNWIPEIGAFAKEVSMVPVIAVLTTTAVKDAIEDYRRYKSDKRINRLVSRVYSGEDDRYHPTAWADIRVGDIVHLSCDETISADILLLKSSNPAGVCHVETSNIDGETNLKQRLVIHNPTFEYNHFEPKNFKDKVECELPNPDIYQFKGSIVRTNGQKCPINKDSLLLRGCIVRNTSYVEGIVLYAGHETKAMLNNRGPRYKRSKLERRMNRDVVGCVVILLFVCFFCSIGAGIWFDIFDDLSKVPFIPIQPYDSNGPLFYGFLVFWTYLIIFQAIIPLPLYISMEVVKLGQVYFMQNDLDLYYEPFDRRLECKALNITEDLGQIEYVFCDKTGTLTENKMDFRSCTINGVDYPHGCDQDEVESIRSSVTNISRSSCMLPDLRMEPALQREISCMSMRSLDSVDIRLPTQSRKVHEFFLVMAICNTVVVTTHTHEDEIDASGNIAHSGVTPTVSRSNTPDISSLPFGGPQHPRRMNSLSDQDYPFVSTPTEGSIAGTESSFVSDAINIRYEAESPDELALVKAACTYGCRLVKRTSTTVTVFMPADGEVDLELLHILAFDATRKRMSIIVKKVLTGEIVLYTKGADSAILTVLEQGWRESDEGKFVVNQTTKHLNSYAKSGLRTLCMARRVLSIKEYRYWRKEHIRAENSMTNREQLVFDSACRIEADLELLGATGIEDQLQELVPETIYKLREAGINVWILTGDKQETAIQVAYSCKLISSDQSLVVINASDVETTESLLDHHFDEMRRARLMPVGNREQTPRPRGDYALIIDGTTLKFALSETLEEKLLNVAQNCSSVVCCRTTPIQKADVVKLVRTNLDKMTLAVGDGANDVSMIQTADVGIGIAGQEGMQAVMASDFAIARFYFLQRLLLVHGHWCYDRLANFSLYMFYKNPLPNFVIFWYQIHSAFSASITIDAYYLMLLHVAFTAFPPLVNGMFDKDLSAETLLKFPKLYQRGQQSKSYTSRLFWLNVLDALLQSLIIYYIPHFAYHGSNVGVWEYGITTTVALLLAMLLHLAIETHTWTVIHWFMMVISFAIFWIFAMVLSGLCLDCDKPSNPYWVIANTVVTPEHWLVVFFTVTLALLPRFTIRAIQMNLFPDEILLAKRYEKDLLRMNECPSEREHGGESVYEAPLMHLDLMAMGDASRQTKGLNGAIEQDASC